MTDQAIQPHSATPLAGWDTGILAGQLAPSSIAQYRKDWGAYTAWCAGCGADPLSATSLARWRVALAETTLAPATINRRIAAVKRIYKEAAAQGYIPAELAAQFRLIDGVKAQALKGRGRAHARTRISPTDMRRLCDAPDAGTLRGLRDRALLATLGSSALRIGELCRMKASDLVVSDEGYQVRVVGKGKAEALLAPLSGEAHTRIQTWIAARGIISEYIFTGFAGRGDRATDRPLSVAGAWGIVTGYAAALGLAHVRPHDFRRFVGTQLAKKDIRLAQKALRHSRIETTARHYVLDDLAVGVTDSLF